MINNNKSREKENINLSSIDNDTEAKKNSNYLLNRIELAPSGVNQQLLIAIKLKGYRSVGKFARDCGFTASYLSKMINRRYRPTIETCEVICKKLGLGIRDVFLISDINIPELDGLLKGGENEN